MNPSGYGYSTPTQPRRDESNSFYMPAEIHLDSTELKIPEIFVFDKDNPNWSEGHGQNVFFLTHSQSIFNDKLKAHGHIFLNEILLALGINPIITGQFVGWARQNNGLVSVEIFEAVYREDQLHHYNLRLNVEGVILLALEKN